MTLVLSHSLVGSLITRNAHSLASFTRLAPLACPAALTQSFALLLVTQLIVFVPLLGGVVALGSYMTLADFSSSKEPIWSDPEENAEKMQRLYKVVDDFSYSLEWAVGAHPSCDCYASLPLPSEKLFDTRREECPLEVMWIVEEAIGYFSSWSGCNSALMENPETNILERLERDLRTVLGGKAEEKLRFRNYDTALSFTVLPAMDEVFLIQCMGALNMVQRNIPQKIVIAQISLNGIWLGFTSLHASMTSFFMLASCFLINQLLCAFCFAAAALT